MSLRAVLDDLGSQAVEFVERSDWPVRTGFSLRHFGHRVSGRDRVSVTNAADYAVYVEQRTGIIERTLKAADWDTEGYENYVARRLGGRP